MPEQRFQQLRKELSPEEFNNIDFLKQKAQQIKEEDPDLSDRILIRVENLENARKPTIVASNKKATKENMKSIVKKNTPNIVNNRVDKKHHTLQALVKYPALIFVLLPTLLFAFYQVFIATERYESQAKIIVQQPDSLATMDAGMAILSGMGMPTSSSDTELVKTYIYSNDMLRYLNEKLDLRAHYSQPGIDFFSRIHPDDTREELLLYYQERVKVVIDEKSKIISVYSQAFDGEYAQKLTNAIVDRAEWFINSIGHQLANEQLTFIQGEHKLIENQLEKAKINLLSFQQKYNLLDPTAEGVAMQQITYTLEGQIAMKQTEINTLKAIMSNKAPQVLSLENELVAMQSQLNTERGKLAQSGRKEMPVSELLAQFTDYKVKMELALQAYTSSQISLEKSRIEAYRQIKYLIVVETATLSEEYKYPEVIYNITLFLILLSMLFVIAKIIFITIKELK